MNIIAHVEIPVVDLDRAMRFYSALFDIKFGDVMNIHGNSMAFFPFTEGQDGASGALAQGEIYVPTRNGAVIYFNVDDVDDAIARAIALGSEILFAKTAVGETSFVAEVSDSEGNRIALQSL